MAVCYAVWVTIGLAVRLVSHQSANVCCSMLLEKNVRGAFVLVVRCTWLGEVLVVSVGPSIGAVDCMLLRDPATIVQNCFLSIDNPSVSLAWAVPCNAYSITVNNSKSCMASDLSGSVLNLHQHSMTI